MKLGHRWEEGGLEACIGVVVGTEGWLSENTSVETRESGVLLSQSVVSTTGCHKHLNHLEETVVSHSDSITVKEVLSSKELDCARNGTSELGEKIIWRV